MTARFETVVEISPLPESIIAQSRKRIDRNVTPYNNFRRELYVLFIFTICFILYS